MATFTIENHQFMLDGQPFRVLAGAIHYFRVPAAYWEDRLLKLKACGLNTVETYIAWNAHQPEPAEAYDFTGMLDVEGFIRLAGKLGLYVIVRPGPYICSEWDFGGLPWWLLKDENTRLRCMDPGYLAAVDKWFDELIPRLTPHLISRGGPILAMQVENEYGSYGNDGDYLDHLRRGMVARGVDCLLFTSDGPGDWMLSGDTLPDVFKTANFGSRARRAFAELDKYEPGGPYMCMEFWNGWFDHWGEPHHRRDPREAAAALDELLGSGGSVCLYMFHGGTNFGFMAGANYDGVHQPTITSYDDDAPVAECGDLTEKYRLFKEVISKYAPVPDVQLLPPVKKIGYGEVALTEQADLFDNLPAPVKSACPLPMERMNQGYGYILYRTHVKGPRQAMPLMLRDVHDRADVYVDGVCRGTVLRDGKGDEIPVEVPAQGVTLDVLVVSEGRINYGPLLKDQKGITQAISLERQFLFGYDIFTRLTEGRDRLRWRPRGGKNGPAFYRGVFRADEAGDTFLALPGCTKGEIWVNGFHVGRYDPRGPQQNYYIPAPLLRTGENELIIFDMTGSEAPRAVLEAMPRLG